MFELFFKAFFVVFVENGLDNEEDSGLAVPFVSTALFFIFLMEILTVDGPFLSKEFWLMHIKCVQLSFFHFNLLPPRLNSLPSIIVLNRRWHILRIILSFHYLLTVLFRIPDRLPHRLLRLSFIY